MSIRTARARWERGHTEAAFAFGEIYRRNGFWKLRAVGQRYASGLARLAEDLRTDVSEEVSTEKPNSDESETVTTGVGMLTRSPTRRGARSRWTCCTEPVVAAAQASPTPKVRPHGARTAKPVPKKAPLIVVSLTAHRPFVSAIRADIDTAQISVQAREIRNRTHPAFRTRTRPTAG